jgi:hypothetical protein
LAANEAVQIRDAVVKTRLAADARYSGPTGAKTKKDGLLNVEAQMPTHVEWENVKRDHAIALAQQTAAVTSGNAKDIADANRNVNAAERTMKGKEKELQEELKKKYAGEIAELDEQIKAIKTQTEVDVEKDTAIITPDQRQKLDVINKARNYAASVRAGRLGHPGGISSMASGTRLDIRRERREELANKMENQREEKIK